MKKIFLVGLLMMTISLFSQNVVDDVYFKPSDTVKSEVKNTHDTLKTIIYENYISYNLDYPYIDMNPFGSYYNPYFSYWNNWSYPYYTWSYNMGIYPYYGFYSYTHNRFHMKNTYFHNYHFNHRKSYKNEYNGDSHRRNNYSTRPTENRVVRRPNTYITPVNRSTTPSTNNYTPQRRSTYTPPVNRTYTPSAPIRSYTPSVNRSSGVNTPNRNSGSRR